MWRCGAARNVDGRKLERCLEIQLDCVEIRECDAYERKKMKGGGRGRGGPREWHRWQTWFQRLSAAQRRLDRNILQTGDVGLDSALQSAHP